MSDGERRRLATEMTELFPALLAEWMEKHDRPKAARTLAALPTDPGFMMEMSGRLEHELRRLLPATVVAVGVQPQATEMRNGGRTR